MFGFAPVAIIPFPLLALNSGSVNSIIVGPCVYLDFARSLSLYVLQIFFSIINGCRRLAAANEGYSKLSAPLMSIAASGFAVHELGLLVSAMVDSTTLAKSTNLTSRMLLRGEDSSVGIRNAEAASVIGWFMEGMLIWLVLRADLRRPSFIPESSS